MAPIICSMRPSATPGISGVAATRLNRSESCGKSLALDPKMKLLIGHGLFDLATPYFATRIALDQLPAYASPNRVKFVVYPGGHMFYSRDGARKAFRDEVQAIMK